jgi:hypothetical protein
MSDYENALRLAHRVELAAARVDIAAGEPFAAYRARVLEAALRDELDDIEDNEEEEV